MKKILTILFLFSSVSVYADGLVPAHKLSDALEECQERPNELRCLKRRVRQLIDSSNGTPNNPSDRLICKSSSNGKFAVYDDKEEKFVDTHYTKTAEECGATIRAARRGLFCSANESSKYAVRRLSDYKFLSGYYNIEFGDCMKTVRSATRRHVCIAGQNNKFARYDLINDTYLDSNYSMTIEECTALNL